MLLKIYLLFLLNELLKLLFMIDNIFLLNKKKKILDFSYNPSMNKFEEHKKLSEKDNNSLVESSYDCHYSYGSSNSSNLVIFSNGVDEDKKEEITMEIEENEFLKITSKK